MKVLFLSQIVPYPPRGGVLQRGYNILREVAAHVDVHLLAFVHQDELPTPEAVAESHAALSVFCRRVEFFPLWAKRSPLHKGLALAWATASGQPFSTVAQASAGFRHRVETLLRDGVDLLHVDTVGLHPFTSVNRRVPQVLTHHNIESQLMARRAGFETSGPVRWLLAHESRKLARYEAAAVRRYRVNLMMSRDDETTLKKMVPGVRTALVPNGVDTQYFRPAPDTGRPTMIYAGGMNMFANRDAVLHFVRDIWPSVIASVPEARFVSVGQDPPAELLQAAARDPRIVVTGKVPDVRSYVNDASVYVVPLRVGGGTRLKVLDAMASGKALVSTTIGAEGLELVPDEHLVIADDPGGFAEQTIALLRDGERRVALGLRARALVESRYAWPIIGRRLADVYAEAAALPADAL